MRRTKKNLRKAALIHQLTKCKDCDRNTLIHFLSDAGIDVLGETVHNILNNHKKFNLNTKTVNKLKKKYKSKRKTLKLLADKSQPVKKRKRVLEQEGGTLGLLLKIALPILSQVLFKHK